MRSPTCLGLKDQDVGSSVFCGSLGPYLQLVVSKSSSRAQARAGACKCLMKGLLCWTLSELYWNLIVQTMVFKFSKCSFKCQHRELGTAQTRARGSELLVDEILGCLRCALRPHLLLLKASANHGHESTHSLER